MYSLTVQKAISLACNSMLAREVEISTFVKLSRDFTNEMFYWASQLIENKKEIHHAMLVSPIYLYERLRKCEERETGEENRDNHWVVRSALHDVINQKPDKWRKALEIFQVSLIENAYEETDCALKAVKFIGVSDKTAIKYVDFKSMNKTEVKPKKPKPRKRNWWESKRKKK